jgi:SAM-dependent methyltransferase
LALDYAIRSGLIDTLARGGVQPLPPALAAILERAGVLAGALLSPEFRKDWQHAGAEITARAAFLRLAASDIVLQGDNLWSDLPAFMQQSATFRFFDYGPAFDGQADAGTAAWVSYVSALTQAEAPALLPHLALPDQGVVLEIGGNAGAFARAILLRHPALRITVLDLPGVCRPAQADPRNQALDGRLSFVAADMRQADFASVAGRAPDVILLKSVLHDWPDQDAANVIRRALAALAPAGRLIIAERGAFAATSLPDLSMRTVANAVFSPFYRDPSVYAAMVRAQNETACIKTTDLMLDMAWHVITVTKDQT